MSKKDIEFTTHFTSIYFGNCYPGKQVFGVPAKTADVEIENNRAVVIGKSKESTTDNEEDETTEGEEMTKAELVQALEQAEIDFDPRAKKAELVELYNSLEG